MQPHSDAIPRRENRHPPALEVVVLLGGLDSVVPHRHPGDEVRHLRHAVALANADLRPAAEGVVFPSAAPAFPPLWAEVVGVGAPDVFSSVAVWVWLALCRSMVDFHTGEIW